MRIAALLIIWLLGPGITWAQQGMVQYSHSFAFMELPTDGMSEFVVEHELSDPRFWPAKSKNVDLDRILEFNTFSSWMYPVKELYYVPGNQFPDPDTYGWEIVDTTYVDHDQASFVESRHFYNEKYLVEDNLPLLNWQLTGNERSYLGYRIMSATAIVDTTVVEAWFTPEIPVPAGPGLYGGLPGLILILTNDAREEVYAAESIDLAAPIDLPRLPSEGRKVSTDAYDKRVAWVIADNQRIYDAAIRALRTTFD